MNHHQPTFFDESERLEKLSKLGDQLVLLNEYIDFESFRADIGQALGRATPKATGRPSYDIVFMFKILILQRLYNLSDQQTEYQINDRLSFQRFLGLHIGSKVPDYTSVWNFREQLVESGAMKSLFDKYVSSLEKQGVVTHTGTILDASFVQVPRQRNSREENEIIKNGGVPEGWKTQPRKLAQKDVEARWAKKGEERYYGYKEHDKGDAQSKIMIDYKVTPAQVSDTKVGENYVREAPGGGSWFGDCAFKSKLIDELLSKAGINNYINDRMKKGEGVLNELYKEINRLKSSIRCRIEHIFGHIENSMGGDTFEYIGLKRITTAVGLRNLTYNFQRYVQLVKTGQVIHGKGWANVSNCATA